jgi:hypothetical protein
LILPLARGDRAPRELTGVGVLSGRGFFRRLWCLLTGQYERYLQYRVPVDNAIELLEEISPDVAWWWRENTPHLIGRGLNFGFDAEVCEEIDGSDDAFVNLQDRQ